MMAGQTVGIPSEPIPEPLNPNMARVFAYWREKCAETEPGPFPRLAEINIIDLHDIAAYLLITDVIREEGARTRYRWRFWGSNLTSFFGKEMTGKLIDEAYTPEAARQIIATYDWMVEHREPHYWVRRGGLAYEDQEHLRYERLICPIQGPSGDIDHLFGIITFVAGPARHFDAADRSKATKASISPDK
jgi:hypothetical protein